MAKFYPKYLLRLSLILLPEVAFIFFSLHLQKYGSWSGGAEGKLGGLLFRFTTAIAYVYTPAVIFLYSYFLMKHRREAGRTIVLLVLIEFVILSCLQLIWSVLHNVPLFSIQGENLIGMLVVLMVVCPIAAALSYAGVLAAKAFLPSKRS